jgi:hypothetical protein
MSCWLLAAYVPIWCGLLYLVVVCNIIQSADRRLIACQTSRLEIANGLALCVKFLRVLVDPTRTPDHAAPSLGLFLQVVINNTTGRPLCRASGLSVFRGPLTRHSPLSSRRQVLTLRIKA